MNKFIALYFRYHSLKGDEFSSLQEAMEFLENGSDYNELQRVCILWDGKVTWINTISYTEAEVAELVKEYMSINPAARRDN